MKTYRTSDYQVAVLLSVYGHKLLQVDKSDYRRSVFEFKSEEGTEELVEAFFKDELQANPRHVLVHAKLVKDRLHAGY